jgi:hypothetical protein
MSNSGKENRELYGIDSAGYQVILKALYELPDFDKFEVRTALVGNAYAPDFSKCNGLSNDPKGNTKGMKAYMAATELLTQIMVPGGPLKPLVGEIIQIYSLNNIKKPEVQEIFNKLKN